jgi:hypothetical protein
MVHPGVSALGKKNSTTVFPRKFFSDTDSRFWSGKVNSGALSLTSMAVSPFRRRLYRTAGWAVIFLLPILTLAQVTSRGSTPKGPRALALLELAPNGKAHLIPIMIMDEGKFFDGSAYKATPVPMTLESGTVYEAVRTGVSQGLFTVTLAGQLKSTWIGQGTWQSAAELAAKASRPAPAKPKETADEPPRLRRPPPEPANAPEPKPEEPKPQAPAGTSATAPTAGTTSSAATPPSPPSTPPPPPEDKDRPVLRRGKPAPRREAEEPFTLPPVLKAPGKTTAAETAGIQLIPAISDADGPEPRPYAYTLKPEEEAQFRAKMLALAGDEVRARMKELRPSLPEAAAQTPPATRRKVPPAAKLPPPKIENVQFRVFDLSYSNEPILVLGADALLPQGASAGAAELPYYVTLVAREDIYGELHQLFATVTDARHLDVLPRLELIDAVDADGDGRGELLFRRVFDTGAAFAVYRVVGNQLWPLFEGTPGE